MFTQNLSRLMEAKGWQPAHLSAAMYDCGATIQDQSIRRWLEGRNEPRLNLLPYIAGALECTYEDLLGVEVSGLASTQKAN